MEKISHSQFSNKEMQSTSSRCTAELYLNFTSPSVAFISTTSCIRTLFLGRIEESDKHNLLCVEPIELIELLSSDWLQTGRFSLPEISTVDLIRFSIGAALSAWDSFHVNGQ